MKRILVVSAVLAVLVPASAAHAGANAAPHPTSAATIAPGPKDAPEYWFDQWHVPQLWADGARGQGVTIAEIDTGVNAQLPELKGRVVAGTDLGEGGNGQVDRASAAFGHGTAMASIMVARPGTLGITGLAPGAKILPVAVPLGGTTDPSDDDHLAQAIRYSAAHGAKIISMSLGGVRVHSRTPVSCPPAEQSAIFYALRRGAVLFASSGNRGQLDDAVEEPGVCVGVVSVGAVDRYGRVAGFSSRHRYLTMTAPGVDVASLGRDPGTAFAGDGTSQATALAAAAAALVWSKYPKLSGQAVVTRLLSTLDRQRRTRDPAYGLGILDARTAVTGSVPSGAVDPVYDVADTFLAQRGTVGVARQRFVSPGSYAVTEAPPSQRPEVVRGLGISAIAALVALLLCAGAVARRRRPGPAPTAAPHSSR